MFDKKYKACQKAKQKGKFFSDKTLDFSEPCLFFAKRLKNPWPVAVTKKA